MTRDLDLLLFGATGFTGALTAEYLATHAPPGLRWALAGRNRDRLASLRDRLAADVGVLEADIAEPRSLRRLAQMSRLVITTVGPYVHYGEPMVAACADAGTDYVDLTGEAEFVDRMYLAYDATARRTGARLVHACGFDSVPHDLGALFTVCQLPPGTAIRLRGYVRLGGTASGGTLASAVSAMSRVRASGAAHRRRRLTESRPDGRRIRGLPGRPGYDRAAGQWVLPLPTIDPQIVLRSARALDRYGPDFSYTHLLAVNNPMTAAGLVAGAGAAFGLAQLPLTRGLLLRARPPGTGPSREQRDKGWFRVRFVADSPTGRVVTEVAGGDPGYGETAKMLAESALCLLGDDVPDTAGQATTAVAMGDALRTRLQAAGITFRIIDQ